MSKLIASYYIDTDDKNVFLVLDSTVWRTLDRMQGGPTDSGLWYLDTELSPKEVCQNLIDVFENKREELAKSGVKRSIIDNSKISLNIQEFLTENWIIHNDTRAKDWLEKKGVAINQI